METRNRSYGFELKLSTMAPMAAPHSYGTLVERCGKLVAIDKRHFQVKEEGGDWAAKTWEGTDVLGWRLRYAHTSTPLDPGLVLVAGGYDKNG